MRCDLGAILRRYREEFLARYGAGLSAQQRRAYDAIARCRTGELGRVRYACPDCGGIHEALCSCGNRHCPSCQGHHILDWVRRQEALLLPCSYHLVTFTVPEEMRPFIHRHQGKAYKAMFDAAEGTLRAFLLDPKVLGVAVPGFMAVLHTWGGMLQFHPHIHILVAGGGTDERGTEWRSKPGGLFIKSENASRVWRAKLLDALRRRVGLQGLAPGMKDRAHIVHCQAVGSGRETLRYLSRYVFRVAISNNRIVGLANDEVIFSHRDSHTKRYRRTSLPALEFIRRFMQHILPKGFVKVRHYGFLHPNARITPDRLRELIYGFYDAMRAYIPDEPQAIEPTPLCCRRCGARLRLLAVCRNPSVPPPLSDSA